MTESSLLGVKNDVIKNFCQLKDTQHNLCHLENVTKRALRAAQKYNLDLSLMEAVCYLHDLTFTEYKSGLKTYIFEGRLITKILNNYLYKFGIDKNEKEIIITACRKHPHSFPFRRLNKKSDLYTKILQDADTLDYFNEKRMKSFFDKRTPPLYPVYKLLKVIRSRFMKIFLNLPYETYENK